MSVLKKPNLLGFFLDKKAEYIRLWGMKTLLLLLVLSLSLHAEDWTVCGKTYHGVTVGQIEADRVHITYDMGVGTIMISDMSPDLQQRFAYDPAAAKAATAAKDKACADANAQLAVETKVAPPAPIVAQSSSVQPVHCTVATAPKPPSNAAQIQQNISDLQADIAQKQSIASRESKSNYSGNGFSDIIQSEQAQVAQLKAELAGH